MPRVLIVVAADALDLYRYFQAGFAEIDAVSVIQDRRRAGAASGAPPGGERRAHSPVDADLQGRRFAIVRLLPA
jgi:hypothetical protein